MVLVETSSFKSRFKIPEINLFIHSFIYLFIYLFIYSFIYLFIC